MFQGGQQHDSQELLLLLVDCLVDSLSYAARAGEQSDAGGSAGGGGGGGDAGGSGGGGGGGGDAGGSSRSSAAYPLLPSSPCADIFAGSTCGETANFIATFVHKIAFLHQI